MNMAREIKQSVTNQETLKFYLLIPLIFPLRLLAWLWWNLYDFIKYIGVKLYYFTYREYPEWER